MVTYRDDRPACLNPVSTLVSRQIFPRFLKQPTSSPVHTGTTHHQSVIIRSVGVRALTGSPRRPPLHHRARLQHCSRPGCSSHNIVGSIPVLAAFTIASPRKSITEPRLMHTNVSPVLKVSETALRLQPGRGRRTYHTHTQTIHWIVVWFKSTFYATPVRAML